MGGPPPLLNIYVELSTPTRETELPISENYWIILLRSRSFGCISTLPEERLQERMMVD